MTTLDLFAGAGAEGDERLGSGTLLLRGFALPCADALLEAIGQVESAAPFRHMVTPGGYAMSVAMTNCGALGWTTDSRGYRYSATDPASGQPWPPIPDVLARLATEAASAAGFVDFEPDACLVNRYVPGAKLSLHQDRDEHDFSAPIVSVSLGMTALFVLGGQKRGDRTARISLHHGDVLAWGGVDRLRYHGVLRLEGAAHPQLGERRINLTLRKAG